MTGKILQRVSAQEIEQPFLLLTRLLLVDLELGVIAWNRLCILVCNFLKAFFCIPVSELFEGRQLQHEVFGLAGVKKSIRGQLK